MKKIEVEVDVDDVLERSELPAIIGPGKGDSSRAWVLYLPGETACICESFEGAAGMLRKWLARRMR